MVERNQVCFTVKAEEMMTQQSINEIARRRCRHDSVEIVEYITSMTLHIRNGITREWIHNDFGDYTGSIAVYCPECGYAGRFARNRPLWVQRVLGDAVSTDWREG